MKRLIKASLICMLLLSLSATALATTKFFDTSIYNGPSQEVNSGSKSSATQMQIQVARCVHEGTFTKVSFRGYWAGTAVTDRFDFSRTGTQTKYYKAVDNFDEGTTVVLKGSVPQTAAVYCKATVGLYWTF